MIESALRSDLLSFVQICILRIEICNRNLLLSTHNQIFLYLLTTQALIYYLDVMF